MGKNGVSIAVGGLTAPAAAVCLSACSVADAGQRHASLTGAATVNAGYLNAHYINDGASANQIDSDVPAC
jgi:hypothetical protein